jgi:DNA-binding response OmpR family regulator
LSTIRVLVASPDEGTRSQIRLTLGADRYTVVEAADTDDAIRAVAGEIPALAILDLTLPGAGALAFARTLRSQPETAGLRVLLLVPRGEEPPAAADVIDASLAFPTTSFALLRKVDDLQAGAEGHPDA